MLQDVPFPTHKGFSNKAAAAAAAAALKQSHKLRPQMDDATTPPPPKEGLCARTWCAFGGQEKRGVVRSCTHDGMQLHFTLTPPARFDIPEGRGECKKGMRGNPFHVRILVLWK
jgi:hypothetical protein